MSSWKPRISKAIRVIISLGILYVCGYIAWYMGHDFVSFLRNPDSVLLHCDGLCTYPRVFGVYSWGCIVLSVAVWFLLRPPEKLRYFFVATFWLLLFILYSSEIIDYSVTPTTYPYSFDLFTYFYKTRLDFLWALCFALGVCVTYLKGRWRLAGIIGQLFIVGAVYCIFSIVSDQVGFFIIV